MTTVISHIPDLIYTQVEIVMFLRQACESAGSQVNWAIENGISPQYVSDVLSMSRKPGVSILKALGFQRLEVYTLLDVYAGTNNSQPQQGGENSPPASLTEQGSPGGGV